MTQGYPNCIRTIIGIGKSADSIVVRHSADEGMNSILDSNYIETKQHLKLEVVETIILKREDLRRDSLDALDAHVQWGAE